MIKLKVRLGTLKNYLQGLVLPRHLRPVRKTQGYINFAEAELLYRLAFGARDGCIVEVGSYRGRSTVALARGSLDGDGAV